MTLPVDAFSFTRDPRAGSRVRSGARGAPHWERQRELTSVTSTRSSATLARSSVAHAGSSARVDRHARASASRSAGIVRCSDGIVQRTAARVDDAMAAGRVEPEDGPVAVTPTMSFAARGTRSATGGRHGRDDRRGTAGNVAASAATTRARFDASWSG
jgi:hypothetical protein